MIVRLMRQIKNVRPWMVAVALASGAAWSSCDSSSDGCEPAALYGPATCTTDEQCVSMNGPGSTCDPGTTFLFDSCGNSVPWGRICSGGATDADADADADVAAEADAEVDEDVMVHYGPPPADADADGDDDIPVLYGPVEAGADADEDVSVFYGPPPIDGGSDVDPGDVSVAYGPPPVDASADIPGTFYGPIPVDADDTPAAYYGPIPVDAGSDETGITPLYGPTPAF